MLQRAESDYRTLISSELFLGLSPVAVTRKLLTRYTKFRVNLKILNFLFTLTHVVNQMFSGKIQRKH